MLKCGALLRVTALGDPRLHNKSRPKVSLRNPHSTDSVMILFLTCGYLFNESVDSGWQQFKRVGNLLQHPAEWQPGVSRLLRTVANEVVNGLHISSPALP